MRAILAAYHPFVIHSMRGRYNSSDLEHRQMDDG